MGRPIKHESPISCTCGKLMVFGGIRTNKILPDAIRWQCKGCGKVISLIDGSPHEGHRPVMYPSIASCICGGEFGRNGTLRPAHMPPADKWTCKECGKSIFLRDGTPARRKYGNRQAQCRP